MTAPLSLPLTRQCDSLPGSGAEPGDAPDSWRCHAVTTYFDRLASARLRLQHEISERILLTEPIAV